MAKYRYRIWLVISFVFLAAAFVMPIYALYNALGSTLQKAVSTLPNYPSNNPQTAPLNSYLAQENAAQSHLLIIVVAVEILLIACFSITLWYGIRCRDRCRSFPPTP